jgi:hypothetical protein
VKKKLKPWSKLSRKESKSRRGKGYRVEYDTVKWFNDQDIFAKRNTQQYKDTIYGNMTACDGFACSSSGVIFWQAKYREHYFTKREEDLLEILCKRFNGESMLFYRDPDKRVLH